MNYHRLLCNLREAERQARCLAGTAFDSYKIACICSKDTSEGTTPGFRREYAIRSKLKYREYMMYYAYVIRIQRVINHVINSNGYRRAYLDEMLAKASSYQYR